MIRLIVGTRPEAIKTQSVVRELKRRKVAVEVIFTGQHADLMDGTGLKPTTDLRCASDNEPEAYLVKLSEALGTLKGYPETVVVQGDTASALAGARHGVLIGANVAHVEAGLRSGDLTDPWPEEAYRIEIDRLASYHFCPTDGNRQHLVAEGLDGVVTGNTIIDALIAMKVVREPGQHVLVTLHRRESFGQPMRDILRGLAAAAKNHPNTPFCCPVHPNPTVREAFRQAQLPPNVILGGPLPYSDFLTFLASARCVLTDSGGVVEEASWLGVPTIVARNHTERPEAIGLTAKLVGKKASDVWEGLDWGLQATVEPSSVFGDGHAAEKIVDVLQNAAVPV